MASSQIDKEKDTDAQRLHYLQVQHALALRADAISIVRTAEEMLRSLGHPVTTAIVPRSERRQRTAAGGRMDESPQSPQSS